MSLCLLVYNLGQRELRKTLKKSNSKVRNQLGKLTNTPTLRWIFQCFQVVHFLRINQSPKVVNLTEERSLILEFLPSSCQKYYLGNNNKKRQTSSPLCHRLPVRFAIALLEELKKINLWEQHALQFLLYVMLPKEIPGWPKIFMPLIFCVLQN